jgi:hypothetical protein
MDKAKEQRVVERFLAGWSGRDTIASIDPCEAPDFDGTLLDGSRFGLELVSLTDETLAQGRAFIDDNFTDELEEAARAAGLDVIFAVHFADYQAVALTDRVRQRLIAGLIAFAEQANGEERVADSDELERLGIEGVDDVLLNPAGGEGASVVVMRHARGRGWTDVQQRIAEKDLKVPAYRERIGRGSQLWLLLEGGSSFEANVVLGLSPSPFVTAFDRLFFLDG